MSRLLCLTVLAVTLAALVVGHVLAAKESHNNDNQPLSGLDKMLKQANGVKVDAFLDQKLANNVTNTLNDMAMNLRKLFAENRRLNQQVQELVVRAQNATGVNATNTLNSIQTSNFTNLANNINLQPLGTIMPRFNA